MLHPALPSHPGYALWLRDFSGAAGLFAVILATESIEKARAFVDSLELFGIGFSWGGYESLAVICDPAHSRSATCWDEKGILIRFHVGLESYGDLQRDLDRSFRTLSS